MAVSILHLTDIHAGPGEEVDQDNQSEPWKLRCAHFTEDVQVHSVDQVWGGLRGPGQAV
jgi:hypothetical protein